MSDFKFNLDSISLIRADFLRQVDLNLSDVENKPDISVKVSHAKIQQEDRQGIDVSLYIKVLVSNNDGADQIAVSAEMLGSFTISGEPPQKTVDYFGNINGPAIIFPFVREVIASLTVKANIAPILLPAMNFVAAYEENLSRQEKNKEPAFETSEIKENLAKPKAKRATRRLK